jgi:transposase
MRGFGLEISENTRPTKGKQRELYARKAGVPRKQLALDFACSPSTINRTLSRFNTHNTLDSLHRSGRPSKLTQAKKRYIRLIVERHSRIS